MSKITLNKKALLDKQTFSFETKDKENLRGAEVDHERGFFRIFFNGRFIFIGKFFPALQKRFDKLVEDWDLEESENE